jgi:hypothetical protein
MGSLQEARGGRRLAWHSGERRVVACLTGMGKKKGVQAKWAGWLARSAQGN